jgi:tetratricopeptide (TPR) repeat protein
LNVGLIGGLRGNIVEAKITPGQGMQMSLRNAISSGLAYAILLGGLWGVIGALGASVTTSLQLTVEHTVALGLWWMLLIGSGFGMLVCLWFGGLDLIKHSVLRAMLSLTNATPRHYIRFLDYATELIFLRRGGGGYIFAHRQLLEYFAILDPTVLRDAELSRGAPISQVRKTATRKRTWASQWRWCIRQARGAHWQWYAVACMLVLEGALAIANYQPQRRFYRALYDAEVYFSAGDQVLRQAGNIKLATLHYGRAIDNYTRAVGLSSGVATVYYKRGQAYYSRALNLNNQEDFRHAVDDYTHAIERNYSPLHLAYARRGLAYASTAAWDQALNDCTRAIALDVKYAFGYVCRGEAYYKRGMAAAAGSAHGASADYQRAIGDYNRALALTPSGDTYIARGEAHAATGNVTQALRDLVSATKLDPEDALV